VRRVLGLLFSMRDIMAVAVMNRLDRSTDMETDLAQVRRLERLGASISESSLRGMLDSPRLAVRREAIRALRRIDFGEKTTRALLRELERGEFTTAAIAAETLGDHGCAEAVPDLRTCLASEDTLLAGRAMVALVRLGDQESLPEIRRLFHGSENPRVVVHGAHALAETGSSGELLTLLRKACDGGLPGPVADEVCTVAAELCGGEAQFYRFLREYNAAPERGLSRLSALVETVLGRPCTLEEGTRELDLELAREVCRAAEEGGAEGQPEGCLEQFRAFLEERDGERVPLQLFACLTAAAGAARQRRREAGGNGVPKEEL
jgi:HEAT repeat protein